MCIRDSMYIIAQKLVWKSNEDGYLVGSRGSVGSSFVATMSGITEVNPLSPHYYCTNCHYYDFDSEEVKKYSGMAGCDMPDKLCPVCGHPLTKDCLLYTSVPRLRAGGEKAGGPEDRGRGEHGRNGASHGLYGVCAV